MKYLPEEELLVLLAIQEFGEARLNEMAIQELGEASLNEINEYIQLHWKNLVETEPPEISEDKLLCYVRRWNKRKAVFGNMVNNVFVYSLAGIPWFSKNQIIRCLQTPIEAQQLIDNYETKLKERKSVQQPVYRDYKQFELTFKTIDCMAGGIPNGERKLRFPKHPDGTPYVPINWFKGWMQQNSSLANLPQTVFIYKTVFTTGEFVEPPKTYTKLVKVKTGLTEYEYIQAGETFKVLMTYPMQGTTIKRPTQLEQLFKMLEAAPIRGLGSYSEHFGGRVKLVEIKQIA